MVIPVYILRFVRSVFLALDFRVRSVCQFGLPDQLVLHLCSIMRLDFAIMAKFHELFCVGFL